MNGKVDLVMWVKNGEATLGRVIANIDRVVPDECVGNRIVVDDHSVDSSRGLCEALGWRVVRSRGHGISEAANHALSLVEADRFCSFEQDLLLSKRWWRMVDGADWSDAGLGAVSGVRFSSDPEYLRRLQEYVYGRYLREGGVPAWLRSREKAAFTLGKTLDNTMYRTSAVRGVGGFPCFGSNAGVDTVLAYRLHRSGFRWRVDYGVRSVHLRLGGFGQELSHVRMYGSVGRRLSVVLAGYGAGGFYGLRSALFRFFVSPFSGLFLALRVGVPRLFFAQVALRFAFLRGVLCEC